MAGPKTDDPRPIPEKAAAQQSSRRPTKELAQLSVPPDIAVLGEDLNAAEKLKLRETFRSAVAQITKTIPALGARYDAKGLKVFVVPDIKIHYAAAIEMFPELAAPSGFQHGSAFTETGVDKVTGKPISYMFIDRKALRDNASAIETVNHELRHVHLDQPRAVARRPERDYHRRELPVYDQTSRDLTKIRDEWKSEMKPRAEIAALEKRIVAQSGMATKLRKK